MPGPQSLGPAHDYVRDAWQRSILFLDVLRQRGNIYRDQQGKTAHHGVKGAPACMKEDSDAHA